LRQVIEVLVARMPEYPLVLGLPTPVSEAGPELAKHDERQHNGLGLLEERHRSGDTFAWVPYSQQRS
jgi:hypothetical protein